MAAMAALDHGQPAQAAGRSRRRGRTPEEHAAEKAAARRSGALESLTAALEHEAQLAVPPPVSEIVERKRGVVPKLPAAAFELARQVYYLNHGSLTDAAEAIIAARLSETDDVERVRDRLRTWWEREGWPKRSTLEAFALRDANHDGGLYRSSRLCAGSATGSGPAPKGKPCEQSALPDSDYCFSHDPRPEYVAKRKAQARRLAHARRYDMVALAPLQRFLDTERKRLLARARASRRVDPKNRGWSLLAEASGLDLSLLERTMQGRHNGGAMRAGRARTRQIRAATAVRYLEALGASFKDVYGFDPPARQSDQQLVCPRCGGPKNHASKVCRDCHEKTFNRCRYVNRHGRRCPTTTDHPSGRCSKCRRITERVPKARPGRASYLSAPMLILATGEYRDIPNLAWVARRMWADNAGGVREVYKSQKTLAGSLVKQFRSRGWRTAADAERAHTRLCKEHGQLGWPTSSQPSGLEAAGMVPFDPFRRWLSQRHAELGSYAALSVRVGINPDHISQWLRGAIAKSTVRRATVDRALAAYGDGTRFEDLYTQEEEP